MLPVFSGWQIAPLFWCNNKTGADEGLMKVQLSSRWCRYHHHHHHHVLSASPTIELVSCRIYCNAVWGVWPVIDTLLSLPTIDISSHELLHKFHLSEGDPVPILSMSCPGHENIPGRLLLLHHLLPLARDAANFYPGLTDFLFCNWFQNSCNNEF